MRRAMEDYIFPNRGCRRNTCSNGEQNYNCFGRNHNVFTGIDSSAGDVMRRGREKDLEKYINVRIGQLKQDMEKAHDDYDKQWYNRIIQELCWVKSQHHNCYIHDELQHWKDTYSYLP